MHALPTRMAIALGALVAFAGDAGADPDVPFRTRNLSPLVSIFGVPVWRAGVEGRALTVTSELANHYRASQNGADILILDGETLRTALHFETSLGERWFAAAELPYYRQSGGVLDDIVDGWHSLFRLPDGGRNNAPEDQLLFQLIDAGGEFYRLTHDATGWGDVQLSAGRRLGGEGRYALTATVKLATGDEALLAGSGSTDYAVTLLRRGERMLGRRRAGGFWGVGLVRAGAADRIDYDGNELVPMAVVGGGWQWLPRVGLKAQLDVSRAFYRSGLEELGQTSAQATLGGWWDVSERGRLEFAVNEDLHVSTSPDVVVHVALTWRWP